MLLLYSFLLYFIYSYHYLIISNIDIFYSEMGLNSCIILINDHVNFIDMMDSMMHNMKI